MAIDAYNNIYLCGIFYGGFDIDPGPASYSFVSAGSYDSYLVKFDANGFFDWGKRFGNFGALAEILDMDVQPNGDLFLTGTYGGTVDFDPDSSEQVLPFMGAFWDAFALKLNHCPNTGVSNNDSVLVVEGTSSIYQWLDCDAGFAPVNGANGPSFSPPTSGNYAVAISNNGCTDTSACHSLTIVPIEEIATSDDIRVFPNPVSRYSSTIYIDLGLNSSATTTRIYNLQGQLLDFKAHPAQQYIQLNIDYPEGLYILEIQTAAQKASFKIVKQ